MGSVFWCELPSSVTESDQAEAQQDDLSGLRVLVKDKSPSYRQICRDYLEHWSAEVETVASADDFLPDFIAGDASSTDLDVVVIPDIRDYGVVEPLKTQFLAVTNSLSP